MRVRDVNRRLLLFAARTRASVRRLRDPRVALAMLWHGARAAPGATLRALRAAVPTAARGVRGVFRLAMLLVGMVAAAVGAIARRAATAVAHAYARIDFEAFRRATLLACALAGGALLIAADFSTVRRVTVLTVTREHVHGGPEHLYALALLGAVALPLAWGAAWGRSRPAMRALTVIGFAALILVAAIDVPRLGSTEGLARIYDDVGGGAAIGFAREVGGGLLLIASGAILLRLTPTPKRRTRRGRRGEMTVEPSPTAPAT